MEVKKTQHRYIIGGKGSGLMEILAATGVSVEVPPTDNSSETITLRGDPDKLGPALTMLYSKACSVHFFLSKMFKHQVFHFFHVEMFSSKVLSAFGMVYHATACCN